MLASRDEILGQRRGLAETFVTTVGADITDARPLKAYCGCAGQVGAAETNGAGDRRQNSRYAFDELILSVSSNARDADDLARGEYRDPAARAARILQGS
jgi:hypothetical protein